MKRAEKEHIYQGFADRLNWAMGEKGYGDRQRANALKDWTGVDSVEAPRKWLRGMSMPKKANMANICSNLGCRKEWLEDGIEPIWVYPNGGMSELLLEELRQRFRAAGPERTQQAVEAIRILLPLDDPPKE